VACDDKPLPVSSSQPAQFAPEQEQLFREVLQLLNERRVPYAVSGAFALQQHTGICRDTKDLDLFVPGEAADRALQSLCDAEFEIEVTDPVWLAKARRKDYYVDIITGMSNAVITVDQSWIDHSTPIELLGVPSRVLGAEELLASKLFVNFRERFDGADTIHVIYRTRGKLDWQRVMKLVGDNWQMMLWTLVLYQFVYPYAADAVPQQLWDDLLERFRKELRDPSSGEFRGSLIDERMFAIDVKEWGLPNLLAQRRQQRAHKISAPGEKAA
jgi:hypothetical protein